jgi:DNA-binding XRE family transcriptional regulator
MRMLIFLDLEELKVEYQIAQEEVAQEVHRQEVTMVSVE